MKTTFVYITIMLSFNPIKNLDKLTYHPEIQLQNKGLTDAKVKNQKVILKDLVVLGHKRAWENLKPPVHFSD